MTFLSTICFTCNPGATNICLQIWVAKLETSYVLQCNKNKRYRGRRDRSAVSIIPPLDFQHTTLVAITKVTTFSTATVIRVVQKCNFKVSKFELMCFCLDKVLMVTIFCSLDVRPSLVMVLAAKEIVGSTNAPMALKKYVKVQSMFRTFCIDQNR